MELLLKLFSRKPLDSDAAKEALAFMIEYGGGVLRPHECGVYEPFEPFQLAALEQYVGWLTNPGGEFCFRRSTEPFPLHGCVSNLLFSEAAATVPPPIICTRWSMRMGSAVVASNGREFIKQLLCDACRTAHVDYGFVVTDHDYRSKNFLSVKEGVSELQQYVGDNPEHGIPGLYWMNFIGPVYVDYFGKQRLAAVRNHAEIDFLDDGAVFLRFGKLPEDSQTPTILEHQRAVIRVLGENAFFDLRNSERRLDVPAPLRQR
jgi:hypothetical protein